jgi:predicted GNAT family N-acyltransferase
VVVELFGINDAAAMREALSIRTRVFVCEQHVPLDEEVDDHDRSDLAARHALLRAARGDPAAATGRFYARDAQTAQIGRLAVLPGARGRGYGAWVLAALLEEAGRRGFIRARLDAQVQARDFYLKAGFADDGAPLWDAGILHQPMTRELP